MDNANGGNVERNVQFPTQVMIDGVNQYVEDYGRCRARP